MKKHEDKGVEMCLREILPRARIEAALPKPVIYTEFGMGEIDLAIKLVPLCIHGASLRIWDRVVCATALNVDPMMLREYVDRADPRMYEAITNVVGEPVIKDFYFLRGDVEDPSLPHKRATQFAVAVSCPNDLLLIDLLLSNPYKPLGRRRPFPGLRDYEGFGLLGETTANSVACARELGCSAIVLTAASIELVPVFARHGFAVDETRSGHQALAMGWGPPMHMDL